MIILLGEGVGGANTVESGCFRFGDVGRATATAMRVSGLS